MWVNDTKDADIPRDHIALISDAGALSARLRVGYRELAVQLQSQRLSTAFADEKNILAIDENNSLIRKVHIVGDQKPLVHGRVVVPNATYRKFQIELDLLGTKFIGETLLYDRPGVSRSAFQYAKVAEGLWARRSLFTIEGYNLLITEVFLPTLIIDKD